jgi:vacuolar protein sorting-associated protein 45
MATRANAPVIRYQRSSDLCFRLAEKFRDKLTQQDQDFAQRVSKTNPPQATTILILDRREDPITPILNQWTYQAMIHEILDIKNNRVDLKHLDNLEADMKEVVLSSDDDKFYRKIMYKNFGEVAEDIHNLV